MSASIIAGLKAAALGSLFGTSIPTLVAFVVGVGTLREDFLGGLLVITLPFLIGFFCAGLGLIVFGLPLTGFLKARRMESQNNYRLGGLFAGLTPPLLFGLAVGGLWFSLAIVFAFGAITGHYWWRFARMQVVENDTGDLVAQFE